MNILMNDPIYLGIYKLDVDETIVQLKENTFTKTIDLNEDNKLDLFEFKAWHKQIVPSLEQIVDEEKLFLFNCCDEDKNHVLDRFEIEKNCESFSSSLLTNYGLDLEQDQENLNTKIVDEL